MCPYFPFKGVGYPIRRQFIVIDRGLIIQEIISNDEVARLGLSNALAENENDYRELFEGPKGYSFDDLLSAFVEKNNWTVKEVKNV